MIQLAHLPAPDRETLKTVARLMLLGVYAGFLAGVVVFALEHVR